MTKAQEQVQKPFYWMNGTIGMHHANNYCWNKKVTWVILIKDTQSCVTPAHIIIHDQEMVMHDCAVTIRHT